MSRCVRVMRLLCRIKSRQIVKPASKAQIVENGTSWLDLLSLTATAEIITRQEKVLGLVLSGQASESDIANVSR